MFEIEYKEGYTAYLDWINSSGPKPPTHMMRTLNPLNAPAGARGFNRPWRTADYGYATRKSRPANEGLH